MRITVAAIGSASPDLAWDRYYDLTRWLEWAPQLRAVAASSDHLVAPMTGKVIGPAHIAARFRVTSVDYEKRSWSWTVSIAVVTVKLHHHVDGIPGGRSRSVVHLDGPAAIVLAYAPLTKWALHRHVNL